MSSVSASAVWVVPPAECGVGRYPIVLNGVYLRLVCNKCFNGIMRIERLNDRQVECSQPSCRNVDLVPMYDRVIQFDSYLLTHFDATDIGGAGKWSWLQKREVTNFICAWSGIQDFVLEISFE